MKGGFTLIEVLASVALLFIVGMALVEISAINTDAYEQYSTIRFDQAPLVTFNPNTFREISDYSALQNVPTQDLLVDKKRDFLTEQILMVSETETLTLIYEKETLELGDETIAVFRFR